MLNDIMFGFFLLTFIGFLGLIIALKEHNLATLAAAILCCGISAVAVSSGMILI